MIIKNSDYIIGRTSWDKKRTMEINKNAIYFKNDENLREPFYKNKWDINKIRNHTIFISQASYPLKGFHMFLKSAQILAKKYTDFKVWVAGPNMIDTSFKNRLKRSGYGHYLRKLIKKYGLVNNIEFIGNKNENEMIDYLLKANVFVQASSLENSSNSLGEAMILGVPCVVSNVGGTSSLIKDKDEGFLYEFGDYQKVVEYVKNIFENKKLATEVGQRARKHAQENHNREKNASDLLLIYKKVLNK